MNAPSTGHPLVDFVIYTAAFLAALGGIHKFVWPALRGAYRLARGTERFIAEYQQTGGFAGLYKELHPNGGSSLRDAVDRVGREARDAAAAAREAVTEAQAAVSEAQRVGEITEELRGYAEDNRNGIARLDRRVTDVTEKAEALGQRQEVLREADARYARDLQGFIEGQYRDALEANEALRASLNEVLLIDAEDKERDR